MKVLFIVRATLFTVRGGDTIQVIETAAELKRLGVEVNIIETDKEINYSCYDLLHFFNIIRPADILIHIKRSQKPFVVSPILIDYSKYDKQHRGGIAGKIFKLLSPSAIEYLKTIYRAASGKDALASTSYLWKGQKRSIREILKKAKCILVNAEEEYEEIVKVHKVAPEYTIIPNGINTKLFNPAPHQYKETDLVLCVARVEGIKNQFNLIKALSGTKYRLILIGKPAPSQKNYYELCKKTAGANISFIDHLPQEKLLAYYSAAKVHVLPSFFEVCGLSSLEAAAMGTSIVITDNGYARSYFKDEAFYCDPAEPDSIFNAVENASAEPENFQLQKRIHEEYSWHQTAEKILSAYQKYVL